MRRLPDAATLRARLDRGDVGSRGAGGTGSPARPVPCRGRIRRPEVAAGVPLRGDRPERPREPRPVGPPGGRDTQPIDPRSAEATGPRRRWRVSAAPSRRGPREASPATPTATSASITSTGSRTDDPPGDWVVVDCIEFDARFRHADPIADIAFLAMELTLEGRGDLAGAFVEAYLRASGDAEGRELLPFYRAYRAAVRGKVEGMKLARARDPRGRPVGGPSPRPGPLALRPLRAGGARPQAVPGAARRPARDRQVHPGARPGRAGRVHRHPLGRGPQGARRPRAARPRLPPRSARISTRPSGTSAPTPSACDGPRRSSSRGDAC